MDAAAQNAKAAEAVAKGNYDKALKALEDLRWNYYGTDAAEVMEQVAREAAQIASATTGRVNQRALKLEKAALEIAAFRRREEQRLSAYDASRMEAAGAGPLTGYDVTPVNLGIGLVGAGLLLISVFLPRVESNTFATVEKNTLIQSGDGWWFILLAIAVAGAVWHAYYRDVRSIAPGVLGLIAIGVAVYDGTNKSALTLCPVNPAATQLGLGCSTASPGIGIYMGGVGGALAVIAAWQIWRSDQYVALDAADDEETGAVDAPPPHEPRSVEDRLRTLQKLRDDSLIDESEFQQRRAAILEQL